MGSTDHFGRVIDYLRISVTDLCNQRCLYCMPEKGINKLGHQDILSFEEILTFVEVAAQEGIKKIRITGGEPLIRRGIVNLVESISKINGIKEVTMTTNGELLKNYAKDLVSAGLSRVNISLDSLNPEKYSKMSRGGDLYATLKGIDAAIDAGLTPVKINTVLIGGFNNSELDSFMEFGKKKDIRCRFIELMPIGEVSSWSSSNFVNSAELFENHPDLEKVDSGELKIAKRFHNKRLDIDVELINSLTGMFCHSCNRLRLTADGIIKPCLHSDIEYSIKPYLKNREELRKFYKTCLINKPKEHNINQEGYKPINRNMNRIGG